MQFSAFTRSSSGNIILFKNLTAIRNVKSIKYYRDDSAGSFTKKEVRWSYDNNYWSSWTNLTQGALSNIEIEGKPFWLEIRYTQPSSGAGNVTSFYFEYVEVPIAQQTTEEISPPEILSTTDFERSSTSTIIVFKNSIALKRVDGIVSYADNSSGSFSKKEFRWSYDNENWSTWDNLALSVLQKLKPYPEENLYLEFKYTLTTVRSGAVSSITLSYTQFEQIIQTSSEETITAEEESSLYTGSGSTPTFSNFNRTKNGLEITFKNLVPITYPEKILSYADNDTGTISKKEFRWSFNNNYWSSWETLTSDNITRITLYPNLYLYLEIRYTLSSVDSGNVTSFSVKYKKLTADQYPVELPDTTTIIPESGNACSTIVKTITKTTYVDDADKLDGEHGAFYLWRPNHKGTQPITSIEGLQTYLNNLSSTILQLDASFLEFDIKYVKEASLSTDFYWDGGELKVDVEVASGVATQVYVDGSLAIRDAEISQLDASIINLNTSKVENATNIGVGDASIFASKSGTTLQFKKLVGSGAAIVTDGTNTITIGLDASFAGEVNSGENIGIGTGIFAEKVGDNLQFKSLNSSENTLSISSTDYDIFIDVSIDYASSSYVDASLLSRDSQISILQTKDLNIDISLNDIWTQFSYVDSSLNNIWLEINQLESSIGRIDISLGDYVRKDGDTMSGSLRIDASIHVTGTTVLEGDVSIGHITITASDAHIHNVAGILFDITNTDHHGEGEITWNAEDGTLEVGMPGGNVYLQVGQEFLVRARNNSGVDIPNGYAVRNTGSVGNYPTIELAIADSSTMQIGVATEDIPNNSWGYVNLGGFVRGFNTSAWIEGTNLYLSDVSNGWYTATPPAAPLPRIWVGVVTRQHATEGAVYTKPTIPMTTHMLSDVNGTTPSSALKFLIWNDASKFWDAGSISYTDLSDYTGLITESSLGNTLYWDSGFLEASTGTTINTLNDIGDVSIGGAVSNQVLTWNGSYWVAQDVSSAGSVSFSYVDGSLLIRDASISYLYNSLDNYVLKSGDTMTGDLSLNSTLYTNDILEYTDGSGINFGNKLSVLGSIDIYNTSDSERIISGNYTYGLYNRSVYDGNYGGFTGFSNINTFSPSSQLSNPYSYGIWNVLTHDNPYESNFVIGISNLTRILDGSVGEVIAVSNSVTNNSHVDTINYFRLLARYNAGSSVTDQRGFYLFGIDGGGSAQNIYGIHIDKTYFSANNINSYGLYIDGSVKNYFSGQIGINKDPEYSLDIDGSLNIDGSLYFWGELFSPGTTVNTLNDIGDVSVGSADINQVLTWNGTYWVAQDVSASGSVSFSYVDGSLLIRDLSISSLFIKDSYIDTSLNDIWSTINSLESSINNLGGNYVKESSLGNSFYWDGEFLEASTGTTINTLNDIGDVSVGGVSFNQVLTWKGTYWEGEDVSAAGGGTSYEYVDGSLAARDSSIDDLYTYFEFVAYTDVVNGGVGWDVINDDSVDGGNDWDMQNTAELTGGTFWDI